MKSKPDQLKALFFAYLPKHPKRYPNPGVAFQIISQAIESWEESGSEIDTLPKYFEQNTSGRFVLAPVNQFVKLFKK